MPVCMCMCVCVRLKEPAKNKSRHSWPCPKTAHVARALNKTNKKRPQINRNKNTHIISLENSSKKGRRILGILLVFFLARDFLLFLCCSTVVVIFLAFWRKCPKNVLFMRGTSSHFHGASSSNQ